MSKAKMKTQTGNVRVMVRVRPFSNREKEYSAKREQELQPVVTVDGNRVTVLDPEKDYEAKDAFEYDEVFWSCTGYGDGTVAQQEDVYAKTGRALLKNALDGYNCCVFAYGQTGSGKTHTMLGAPSARGVSYLLIDELFEHIAAQKETDPGTIFTVEVSFMEIYNEQVRDLFNKKAKQGEYGDIIIRQDPVKGILVQGLIRKKVASPEECAQAMERGVAERALAETKMNATSSRSHAICQISILQANAKTGRRTESLMNLVDLAGSERLKMSGVEGAAAKEAKNINLSLSTLRRVFDTLIANSKKSGTPEVPPYRDSKLTWVLKESLGGNSLTMMIAAISPHEENLEDTYSTLRYALKAKAIVCKVIRNEQVNSKMVESLRDELAVLREQLAEANNTVSDEQREELEAQYQEELAEKMKALEEAQEVQKEMETVRKTLDEQVEKLEEERADMRLRVSNEKKMKYARAFRAAFAIKKEKVELEAVAKELRAEVAEKRKLMAANSELEADLQRTKDSAVSSQRSMQRDNTILSRQIDGYRNKANQVDAELLDLQLRKTELETEAKRARAKMRASDVHTMHLQQLLNEKIERVEELASAGREVAALRKRVRELEGENDELRKKKEGYKRRTAGLMVQREADEKLITQLKTAQTHQQQQFINQLLGSHAAVLSSSPSPQRVRSPSPAVGDAAASKRLIAKLSANIEDFRTAVASPPPRTSLSPSPPRGRHADPGSPYGSPYGR